jgi:asparagine synthase (glutamine-hydrolysing)
VCGIIASFGPVDPARLAHRGPDHQGTFELGLVTLGHTRLAIQDPTARSDQPLTAGPVTVAYNGEIFNHQALRDELDWEWQTTGDTETLAVGLYRCGPSWLAKVDGMFAVVWVDDRDGGTMIHAARDRQGEIPLHLSRAHPVTVASERKALDAKGEAVIDIRPGTYCRITGSAMKVTTFHELIARPIYATLADAAATTRKLLTQAVQSRSLSDVPVCTLLSGGIDSAIITYELAQITDQLTCYTARLDPKSPDLIAARLVARSLGVELVEVDIPIPTADDLGRVVGAIEQDSKAQIEIAWPCLHLAQAIHADGFKVTFSGEGSDELWGSYEMSYHGIRDQGWYEYRRKLTATQARRNFPRVNKVFMASSVEARLPFCDPTVVDYALSLPMDAVRTGKDARSRKAVLSQAYTDVLPAEITDRPKAAFQVALGLSKVIPVTDPARFYRAEYRRKYG